jgi:glycosyltransferase involved in cell wall biosynthesis
MRKNLILSIVLALLSVWAKAQNDTTNKVTIATPQYCDPKLVGMAPSKGFYISYERTGNASITSTSRDTAVGNSSANIERNNKFEVSLKFPIKRKGSLKLIGGFRYLYEEFTFKDASGFSDYALYSNLQQKHLKSIGVNLSILQSLGETKFLIWRNDFDLNGDYTSKDLPTSSFIKASSSLLYGWKKCETKSTAIGLYLNYSLGRQSLAPVFLYNNTFSKHWGVEALLPAAAKLRYNLNEKSLMYAGYTLEGGSYNLDIDNPAIQQYKSLQLRKSNIRFFLEFQREIYKFVWFSVTTGMRLPTNFNLTTKDDKGGSISLTKGIVKGEQLIENTVSMAPFLNVTIFITPPKTLTNQVINAK